MDCRNIPMECAHSQNGAGQSDENGTGSFFLCFEAPTWLRPVPDLVQTTLNTQFICWSFGPSAAGARNYSQSLWAPRCGASN